MNEERKALFGAPFLFTKLKKNGIMIVIGSYYGEIL